MPPNERLQKLIEQLFSEPEQIANVPLRDGKKPPAEKESTLPVANVALKSSSVSDISTLGGEMDALTARILELEAKLKESEMRANLAEAKLAASQKAASAPAIIYEKEKVGYAYRGENVEPLQGIDIPKEELEDGIETPLTASGEVVGEIKIKPPAEHVWTNEEESLATAVAQQASLQIQNLRLLAATERARAEAQAATRRFTHENWESFLDGIHHSERIGYVYNQAEVAPFAESVPNEHDLHETVNIFDEQVGNLFLKADPVRPLTAEDKALVSAVARQLAQQVENLRLLADASRARADAEEATRRLMHENWQSFAAEHGEAALGFVYDSVQVKPLRAGSPPQDIAFVQPLSVRGETIGQLAVAGWKYVPPEAMALASAVAEQVSMHIENLRLFERNEKRAHEMETVAKVSATTATLLDPDRLLYAVVDLAKERFGLYHAHIYLADPAWQTLILAAGAGEIGRQMVAEEHAISVKAERSLVARAARERQAVIVNDVRSDPDYLPNPSLPDTRSEMAVPIIVGDKVLGVFDVQSDRQSGFGKEEASIYSTLAAQVGVALQNARLYVEQASTVTQLRELDRLKSSFLANMSHELRTPLNSILGFSDVMLDGLDGPLTETMENDLKLISRNGQHLLSLINDVLDMAKITAGKMNLNIERFNVYEVLTDVVNIASPLARDKALDLHLQTAASSTLMLEADHTRLRQVMINLVGNAIKFTEAGSVVLSAAQHDGRVRINVRDTGIGVPPALAQMIFEEFGQVDSSTTRKTGGTGLGLPISRKLIELHGGQLWVESTGVRGEGSTFIIELPATREAQHD